MSGLEPHLRSSHVVSTQDSVDISAQGFGSAPGPSGTIDSGRTSALDEFTASIAHEVKQPLAAIIMNGETCLRWLDREQPQLDKARANVTAMIRSALRSCEIIQHLRALSARADIPRIELDLNEILRDVASLIEPELARNKVSLRLDLAPDLAPVLADRVQLQQVISNLLLNGIQAMAAVKGRRRELLIRSLSHDVDQVVVVVQDNGTGIDPHHLDRLFNAFFTTKVGGTGIGLSICRSVIEAHGGRIWASRNSDRGATFHFTLPGLPPALDSASRNTNRVLSFRSALS